LVGKPSGNFIPEGKLTGVFKVTEIFTSVFLTGLGNFPLWEKGVALDILNFGRGRRHNLGLSVFTEKFPGLCFPNPKPTFLPPPFVSPPRVFSTWCHSAFLGLNFIDGVGEGPVWAPNGRPIGLSPLHWEGSGTPGGNIHVFLSRAIKRYTGFKTWGSFFPRQQLKKRGFYWHPLGPPMCAPKRRGCPPLCCPLYIFFSTAHNRL